MGVKVLKVFTHTAIALGIAYLCNWLWNMDFEIPKETRGWLIVTFVTPIVGSIISSENLINIFKKFVCYYHTWNTNSTYDAVTWLDHYINIHKRWTQENITNIAYSKNTHWWDTEKISEKPQTRELPSGWCSMKYKGNIMIIFNSFPKMSGGWRARKEKFITIYSLKKVDWKEFIEHVKEFYYNDISKKRMLVYTGYGRHGWWDSEYIEHKNGIGRDSCFGNVEKEECWDSVVKFFTPETKALYRRLGQTYRTSFLIHGPPGTGKSELFFLISSYLWSTLNKPIYLLNPRGMTDETLMDMVSQVTSGMILVDEWDMCISLPKSYSGRNRSSTKDTSSDGGSDSGTKDDKDSEDDRDIDRAIYPTVVGWHQVLDRSNGENIFWFTTNNLKKLQEINNGSLIRDGRIDYIKEFKGTTRSEVMKIIERFSPETEIDVDQIPEGLNVASVISNIRNNGVFRIDKLETRSIVVPTTEIESMERKHGFVRDGASSPVSSVKSV